MTTNLLQWRRKVWRLNKAVIVFAVAIGKIVKTPFSHNEILQIRTFGQIKLFT